MHALFDQLIDWYRGALENGGYPLIALLMFVESTFIPLPSELVIPFAAHYARASGQLSLPGIVIAGALGSWAGATTMYWAARWAGRPLAFKFSAALIGWAAWLDRWPLAGKFARSLLVSPEKIEKAERWAAHYGSFGIFASRLLPVVRHLIGIPAGIVRMSWWKFSLHTLLGSALWCSVLAWVGVKAGEDEQLMNGELHRIVLWLVGGLVVLGAIYYAFVHRQMQARK